MLELISAVLVTGIAIMVFTPLFSKPRSQRQKISVAIGVLTPVASAALYLMMGSSTSVVAEPASVEVKNIEPIIPPSLGSVEEMANRLHKRLLQNPDDTKGWQLLAQSYEHMGDTKAALAARKRAETSTSANEKSQQIDQKVSLRGTITLSSGLATLVEETDTVFVYAHEANGPRMPIAARRYSAKYFPIEFVLDETNILATSRPLASVARLFVGAKISRSGDAISTEQKLVGLSQEISPYAKAALEIVIERQPAND